MTKGHRFDKGHGFEYDIHPSTRRDAVLTRASYAQSQTTRRHLEYSYSTTDTTLSGTGECQGPDVALVIHFC